MHCHAITTPGKKCNIVQFTVDYPSGSADWRLEYDRGFLKGSAVNHTGFAADIQLSKIRSRDSKPKPVLNDLLDDLERVKKEATARTGFEMDEQFMEENIAKAEVERERERAMMEMDMRCCAEMLFPYSGRYGFDKLQLPSGLASPDKDTLVAALQCENKVRLSPEAQDLLSASWAMSPKQGALLRKGVYEISQQIASTTVDLHENAEQGARVLRAAQSLFPEDQDIAAQAYYIRYNRAHLGSELSVGSCVPDVQLVSLDGEEAMLTQHLAGLQPAGRCGSPCPIPTVLVAGSVS
jgi:hypothetical protein